jgi:hypothetical protein
MMLSAFDYFLAFLTAHCTGSTKDLLRFSESPQCAVKLDDVRFPHRATVVELAKSY